MSYVRRHGLGLWQVAYLLFATSWLFAPFLNYNLSDRETLINQFSIPGMPYAWLFRSCEFIAGCLLVFIAFQLYLKKRRMSLPVILVALIGVATIITVLVPTTCTIVDSVCAEYLSPQLVVHRIVTALSAGSLFILAGWDAWKNKNVPSNIFFGLQIVVGLIFFSHLADIYDVSTISQFLYQGVSVVWIAWFVTNQLREKQKINLFRQNFIIKALAVWIGLQAIGAILLGVAHIDYFSNFKGLYFGDDAALLGNYGIVVGVCLLYICRHIARGERRAWQLVLVILGLEILKYAAILPHPVILGLYIATFIFVFVSKRYFSRGLVAQTWRSKVYDTAVIIGGVLIATVVVGYILSYTRLDGVVDQALTHTQGVISRTHRFTQEHTLNKIETRAGEALVLATLWFILWTLFRPANLINSGVSKQELQEVQDVLDGASRSTEDFFKTWPHDKEYFWSEDRDAFIAFKVVGPIAFALADPIASNSVRQKKLLEEFITYCQEHGWRACFLLISEMSKPMYEKAGLRSMQIGASAVINIQDYVDQTSSNKWWRWQRNKGKKMNYQYEVLTPPHSATTLNNLKKVSDEWLKRGGHREEGFALGYFDEEYLQRCRLHTLRDEQGHIVAFVNEMPVFNNLPQTTIDLIRFVDDAPNANNYLLYNVLHQLDTENKFKFFDIGFVPLAQMKGRVANIARTLGANRFSASGLEQFKGKFVPDWRPNYIAYDGDLGDLALIALHLERAMAVDLEK
jgi:lysylphosphatidylglycerol synthetase-like protein (DUF2156 family)